MPILKRYVFLEILLFFQEWLPKPNPMLTTSTAKFCVEPRSPFSNISHHDPQTWGKPLIIVSWPECRPEFPSDGGGVPTTLDIWRSPGPTCPGTKYPVRGIPHFDEARRAASEARNLGCKDCLLVSILGSNIEAYGTQQITCEVSILVCAPSRQPTEQNNWDAKFAF